MAPGPATDVCAVLGLGSIGRRHAATLMSLGREVVAFDPDPARATGAPAGVRAVVTEDAALHEASVVIVASPTAEHARQARAALGRGCHVLVEKPLATDAESGETLVEIAREAGVVLAVAMNLRFHPGPQRVRDILSEGRIGRALTAHFSFGYYLPSWRPQADYRSGYSARRELGGGVLFDGIHELDYAAWILGPVVEVGAIVERVSELDLDVEDVVKINARHESGTVSGFDLDYLDRTYRRGCRIVGSSGTVEWNWTTEQVRVWDSQQRCESFEVSSDPSPGYRLEVEEFLTAAGGRLVADDRLLATGEEGVASLAVVDAVRESARTARRIRVEPGDLA